jgi:hypothetical protein
MTMPGEAAPIESIVLMGDPRVTAIPVSDNGAELVDVRDYGLRVSQFRADDTVTSCTSAPGSPPG